MELQDKCRVACCKVSDLEGLPSYSLLSHPSINLFAFSPVLSYNYFATHTYSHTYTSDAHTLTSDTHNRHTHIHIYIYTHTHTHMYKL